MKQNEKKRVLRLFTITLLICTTSLIGCTRSCNKENSESKEHAAAAVNGKSIQIAELDALHKRSAGRFEQTGRPVSEELSSKLRGSILRKMIDDEIIRQKAIQEKVTVDRFERVEALEEYKKRLGGEKAYQYFLQQQNLTEDQVLNSVLAELQREKLIKKVGGIVEPTPQEIKEHYETNQQLYTLPEMVRARHILLKLSPDEPKEKAALVQKKAQQVLKEARAKGASFEALAQKYSEGPSGKKGGDLGFFPRGRMVKNFESAAFTAPLKTPIGPIQTDFGLHIIFVEEKTAARPAPLEEVRDRIVEFVSRNKLSKKTQELLKEWREDADIEIYDTALTLDQYKDLSTESPFAEKE